MNSHESSSCLLAVTITIFVTVTAAHGFHIVSPPAKIAGHDSRSSVVGAGSRITYPITVIKTPPDTITADDSDTVIQCCDHWWNGTFTDQSAPTLCKHCNEMCRLGAMDARHNDHLLRTVCRCHAVASCLHISFAMNTTLYGGANLAPKNDGNHDNVPVAYGTLAKSAWYRLTFVVLTLLSSFMMMTTAFIYYLLKSRKHSRYVENLTISIASLSYIALIDETIRHSTVADFKSTGIYKLLIIINAHCWQLATNIELYNTLKSMGNVSKFNKKILKRTTFEQFCWFFLIINISITFCYIDIFHQVDETIIRFFNEHDILGVEFFIKHSILIGLIPGLVNIIVYLYLFKYKENKISSIHPQLLSFYKKRISSRNLMFKLAVLMFIVDVLYVLDILMEWDFAVIYILHLLKSAQGILVSYLILFRPFAPVLYTKLLKRQRRRQGSANEETPNPIYTITTV